MYKSSRRHHKQHTFSLLPPLRPLTLSACAGARGIQIRSGVFHVTISKSVTSTYLHLCHHLLPILSSNYKSHCRRLRQHQILSSTVEDSISLPQSTMFKYVILALACVAVANAGVLPTIEAYSTGITHAAAPIAYSAPVVASAPLIASPLTYSTSVAHIAPVSVSSYSTSIVHPSPIGYSALY